MITKELIAKAAKKKDPKTIYELRLADMKITQIDNLEDLIKLREIDLSNNQIKDIEPLNCLKELRSVNLSSNLIVSIPPLKLAYLQKLDLSCNAIAKVKNISHLKKLMHLNLSSNCIEKIEDISGLTELKSLDLSSNKITRIEGISSLIRLEELSLNYLPLSVPISPKEFAKVTLLEKLNISHSQINDPGFLSALPNLLELDISHNSFDRISDFPPVKTLLWLKISYTGIYSLSEIGSRFPSLNVLDVRNNELLTENDFNPLIELKDLADIAVAGNPLSEKCEYHFNVVAWTKKNMPLIETVDNVKVNEAGHRFDLELQQSVKSINAELLGTEESKKTFKEFKEKVTKSKEMEEVRVSIPSTPVGKVKEVLSGTAELETLTKQVLDDMERLFKKETDSYEKATQIWPDVFLTSQEPAIKVEGEKENVSENEKKKGNEPEQKVAKQVNTEKKEKIQRLTSIKKILQYQKEVKKGITAMSKTNGFLQPSRPVLHRPSSRAKNKYELARQIDSSINPK